ncbi:MAG: NAD(P)/FAD-dependent oxidoreductase [Runella slithyformis]|nr:MAG: NAD(P)/FAD-dependent oxidoreductase [Runella slithyformis]TAF94935.1 MAG: NAD(P)/FAD-dependent oxidoreductase [Runella sp.]TAG18298.1 MAG: NAD(P)/FAD-dependent oxidoreductase [Cytophagales bacterium]TAG37789.1 MAG: NAD(P)/FAD-dependent oxidoreductase [Cytophagia bacterium]TAF28322.1 MAG: NAD(P)/FAD-dependent oxidoreductase [Runella slithyformis]
MTPNIPKTEQKRLVIVGAGFGGLMLARKLSDQADLQIVLIDKNNYHQFQPLFYQVAMAGLEPSSIAFPLRKAFQSKKNVHIRVGEVKSVNTEASAIETDLGVIEYDFLVLAMGADTNFFGMKNMMENAMPMKSVSEALAIRNRMLENFEKALSVETLEERLGLMNIVIVGGGPTGVEIAGTLAEMKRHILPKDYPELNFDSMQIYLYESSPEVLEVMSDQASKKAKEYLTDLGVNLRLGVRISDFDGKYAYTNTGDRLRTNNLIWAAGVKANSIDGLPAEAVGRGGRLKVNRFNQVESTQNVFAIGDLALMAEEKYPNGHPQLAQPALQQGELLAKNVARLLRGQAMQPFTYKDLGSMATVGRNLAVVDLPFWKFQGFFAWLTWMFVHLISIVGVKNRLLIFINWLWNYVTYDQSLRLIIKTKKV